jgi:hypothetical protein
MERFLLWLIDLIGQIFLKVLDFILQPTFRRSDSDGYDFLKKQSGKNLSTNFQVI